MTGSALSLLDWLGEVARSPQAQARMAADPEGYLRDNGFDGLRAADVHQALPLVADTIAAGGGGWFDGLQALPSPVAMPGESDLQATARQIHYFSDHARFDDEQPAWHQDDPFDLDEHQSVHIGSFDERPHGNGEPAQMLGDHHLDDLDDDPPQPGHAGPAPDPVAGFGRGAAGDPQDHLPGAGAAAHGWAHRDGAHLDHDLDDAGTRATGHGATHDTGPYDGEHHTGHDTTEHDTTAHEHDAALHPTAHDPTEHLGDDVTHGPI